MFSKARFRVVFGMKSGLVNLEDMGKAFRIVPG